MHVDDVLATTAASSDAALIDGHPEPLAFGMAFAGRIIRRGPD